MQEYGWGKFPNSREVHVHSYAPDQLIVTDIVKYDPVRFIAGIIWASESGDSP
jgi:hypothetical protein